MSLSDAGGEYVNYLKWECYQNGMYGTKSKKDSVISVVEIFKSFDLQDKMTDCVLTWKNSSKHFLTKEKGNPLSWIGQATMCFLGGYNEKDTRDAWFELNDEEREFANMCAQNVLDDYLQANKLQQSMWSSKDEW